MKSYQSEIPKARVNITLDVDVGDAKKKKELPLKLLVMGKFNPGKDDAPITDRKKFSTAGKSPDGILNLIAPSIQLNLTKKNESQGEFPVNLTFKSMKDFHPDNLIQNMPVLNDLLAVRNLLKDLQANVIDNKDFKKALESIVKDEKQRVGLHKFLQDMAPIKHNEQLP